MTTVNGHNTLHRTTGGTGGNKCIYILFGDPMDLGNHYIQNQHVFQELFFNYPVVYERDAVKKWQ